MKRPIAGTSNDHQAQADRKHDQGRSYQLEDGEPGVRERSTAAGRATARSSAPRRAVARSAPGYERPHRTILLAQPGDAAGTSRPRMQIDGSALAVQIAGRRIM